jgi:WD40 repeat protein
MPKQKTIQPEEEIKDFTEIGGSPVPGLTLRHVLRGHTDRINRIDWSPDGKYLASPSHDKTIRIWNITSGKNIASLGENQYEVISVAWSPNSKILASGTRKGIINLWDTESWQPISTLYRGWIQL